ncbi:MAG: hypothetical protein R3C70_13040 [Geminicoccaceae bacterium]
MSIQTSLTNPELCSALSSWRPRDFMRFCWQAARAGKGGPPPVADGLGEEMVEALLCEPLIATLVATWQCCDDEEDQEAYRTFLRPIVRSCFERALMAEPINFRFVCFAHYCFEVAGLDPVERALDLLLKSLRAKRRARRKAIKAMQPPAPQPAPELPAPPADLADFEPTHEELFAERFTSRLRNIESAIIDGVAERLSDPDGLPVTGKHRPTQTAIARKAAALRSSTLNQSGNTLLEQNLQATLTPLPKQRQKNKRSHRTEKPDRNNPPRAP